MSSPIKRSTAVPLLLIGTLGAVWALSGDDEDVEVEYRQFAYRTLEDCQQDWGSTSYCEEDAKIDPNAPALASSANPTASSSGGATGSSSYYSGRLWHGPRFYWVHLPEGGYPVQLNRDGSYRRIHGASVTSLNSQRAIPGLSKAGTLFTDPPQQVHKNISRRGFGQRASFHSGGG